MTNTPEEIKQRLEYLRGEINAERISYGEIAELTGLVEHIEPGDVQLLEWAGVPEFPDDEDEDAPTYRIVRFFQDRDKPKEVIDTGLTFQDAKDHCNDPDTRGDGWFDGFEEE